MGSWPMVRTQLEAIETFPLGRAWIQPEENLLSALIRPPSPPEGVAPEYLVEANLELMKKQDNNGLQTDLLRTTTCRRRP